MRASGDLGTGGPATATGADVPLRLRHPADIRTVFGSGVVARVPAVTVHARRRPGGLTARATIVAGRQLGGAVVRNRAKRRVRAAAALVGMPLGVDVVLIARLPALRLPFAELVDQVAGAVAQAAAKAGSR